MATVLGIRPRASIDDARPVLFYGDEPRTTFEQDRPTRPLLKYEPGRPVNGLPGATSTDDMHPSGSTADFGPGSLVTADARNSSPIVERRTPRERPRLSLGDILGRPKPVPDAPTYQKKSKHSVGIASKQRWAVRVTTRAEDSKG